VCSAPRLCRRRERHVIRARFDRWLEENVCAGSMFDLVVSFAALCVTHYRSTGRARFDRWREEN